MGDNVVDADQLAALIARLRSVRDGVVIALDEEGGDVTRVEMRTGSSYPGNAALGAIDDPALTEAVAASIGAELAAHRGHLDLAPCVDVNSNPANPVIGTRSFGADPALVSRHAAAFVRGLHRAGVAACAKHFPGHGDTSLDSHQELPRVDAPLDVLRARELAPFRAAIAAGVDAVMTSHVVLTAFDDAPATVSAGILGGLLRHELGFDGVVVTDALDMKAVSRDRTIASVAVDALAAGADLVCLGAGHDDTVVDNARAAIDGALAGGRIGAERLADAAERVGRVTSTMVPGRATVDRGLGACAARRALRVHGRLPGDLRASHVVELRPPPHQAAGDVPWGLAEAISALGGRATVTRLAPGDDHRDALTAAGGRPLVVVVRDPHRLPWQAALLTSLAAARPDAVVVDVGWPGPDPLPGAALIRTYGASRASTDAVATLLLRDKDPHG